MANILTDGILSAFGRFLMKKGFFYRPSFMLGHKGPVWINTEKPYLLFNTIPHLKTVITRKSSMFANMQIKLIEISTGEEKHDERLYKLLENPNCLQTQNEFLRQFKEQEQVYGNQFIYSNKPSVVSTWPVALWNISPSYLQPNLSGKIFEQVNKEDIIINYKLKMNGEMKDYDTKDILWSKVSDLDNPIQGTSPLISLKLPLSNIEASYEYRNVVMREKGAVGILSNNSKDSMGASPLLPDERANIEKTYRNKYGIDEDQAKVILTEASLTWTPMSYPLREMMLLEEEDQDMLVLVDHFGLNINIFSSKNATFENVRQSMIQCYEDTIQPEADQFMQSLTQFLQVPVGYKLQASYEHLAIMKENKLKGMAALNSVVASLTQSIQAGLMTGTQAEIILANELGIKAEAVDTNSKTLNNLNRLSPLVANKVLDSMTINQKLALIGLPPVKDGDATPVPSSTVGITATA